MKSGAALDSLIGIENCRSRIFYPTPPSDSIPFGVKVVLDSVIRVGNCVVVENELDSTIRVGVVVENDVEVTTAESDVVDAVT